MSADPYRAGELRAAALHAWRADPSRLRQDANLEEDHARGYYRDRVLVELAQNAADAAAADAAAAGGASGRLLLQLGRGPDGAVLWAANTGAPLDRDGVAALATLRASAKQGAGVGRFGVGFSAVRSVSDEIVIVSREGAGPAAVRFSATGTAQVLADEAAAHPVLAAEVARRGGDLPVLRMPFTAEVTGGVDAPAVAEDGVTHLPAGLSAPVPDGYVTVVRLLLRDDGAEQAVRSALAAVDDTTLLALSSLGSVTIEVDGHRRELRDVGDRWLTVRDTGTLPGALLAERPTEERERQEWTLCWALPRAGRTDNESLTGDVVPAPLTRTLHAPTPTDEPVTLPALLIGSFPVDPSRRRVAPGAITDHLVERAGELYAKLVRHVGGFPGPNDPDDPNDPDEPTSPAAGGDYAADQPGDPFHPAGADSEPAAQPDDWGAEEPLGNCPDALSLVPAGLGSGPLDTALREATLSELSRTPFLADVADGTGTSPRAAQTLTGPLGQDRAVLAALAPMVGGLVEVPTALLTQARIVGVALRDPGELIDTLPAPPAEGLLALYDALAPHLSTSREVLLGLPVRLRGGQVVRGAHGAVIPPARDAALSRVLELLPGVRVVDPAASHPLLLDLGAQEAAPAALLERPELRAGVEDADETATTAALELVALAVAGSGSSPPGLPSWLGGALLVTADGDEDEAAQLVLPGSWAAGVLTGLASVDESVVERWGAATLRALGVREGLRTVELAEVVADSYGTAEDEPVEGWWDYLGMLAEVVGEGAYLGDLTAVADLDVVADDAWPVLLAQLAADPAARAALLTPVRTTAIGRGELVTLPSYTSWWLREELGAPFAHPAGRPSLPLLAPAPAAVTGLDDAVLVAIGAVAAPGDLDDAGWQAYVDGWPAEAELPLDQMVTLWRALAAAAARGVRLEPVARVPVLDGDRARLAPVEDAVVASVMWAPVRPILPAATHDVVAVADLLDLDDVGAQPPRATGAVRQRTPAAVLDLLPLAPDSWWECAELRVEDAVVDWWVHDGTAWASSPIGAARALADAAGSWSARHVVAALLAEPTAAVEALTEWVADR